MACEHLMLLILFFFVFKLNVTQQHCCLAQSLDTRNGMCNSYCTTFWTLDKLYKLVDCMQCVLTAGVMGI